MSEKTETMDQLRMMFKYFNRFMIFMWRLGLGNWINSWPEGFGRIMVLVQTGRKTGIKRSTPVNYAIVDGKLYCTVGFGDQTHWYKNIMENPEVEVWLPNGLFQPISWNKGQAKDVTGFDGYLKPLRQVLINSGFVAEMAEYDPKNDSDEKLAEMTKDYRLVCIENLQPKTGQGGPYDLIWFWPIGFVLLLLILIIVILFRNRS